MSDIVCAYIHKKEHNGKPCPAAYGPIIMCATECPLDKQDNQHTPGAKLDTGKPRVGLVLGGFARALLEVSKVGTFGADKYTDNGWTEVPDGIKRYNDAKNRHALEGAITTHDPESGYLHAAHEAWNALAKLDLMLREAQAQGVQL